VDDVSRRRKPERKPLPSVHHGAGSFIAADWTNRLLNGSVTKRFQLQGGEGVGGLSQSHWVRADLNADIHKIVRLGSTYV
jgi:hypothetical protein